jgi:hypothetical protein
MEPRPQRPSRGTGPFISTGTPAQPSSSSGGYGGVYDASSAPPAPPPAIGYDPDYSPGQPLTPLRGPRGANIVGPLLAVAALAIIVAAVAFIVSQFRDGDNNNTAPTVVAATDGTPDDDDEDDEVVAGEGDPTEEAAGDPDDSEDPTGEAGAPDDAGAEPTRTPRVNRPTETDDELSAGGDEPEETDDEEPVDRTRARQWLPTADEIGDGFEQSENGTRDEAGVAGSFGDPADAAIKLDEFGWVENTFRNYEDAGAGDADVYVVSVSVHRFETENGAKDALEYFAAGAGLAEVQGDRIGEGSIFVQGVIEGGNIFVVYVRQGEFVFRIGGLSRTGDPKDVTIEITERIIEP